MEPPNDPMLEIPHAEALGLRVVHYADDSVRVKAPYAAHLVGDPDTGIVHGGVLTALLDNTCGMAVRPPGVERAEMAIATLDLRIDYMGAAEPHRDIFAEATCYKRTKHVAFVRATAYQSSPHEPIATCVAAFMIGTPNAPRDKSSGDAP
jgi:uncharacterized protein (TIGR00369 family)